MAGDVPVDERIFIAPGDGAATAGPGLLAARGARTDDRSDEGGQPSTGSGHGSTDTAGGPVASDADDLGGAELNAGERALHRYGRVRVLGGPTDTTPGPGPTPVAAGSGPAATSGPTPPPTPTAPGSTDGTADGTVVTAAGLTAGLNRTETLGLEAFRLRASAGYRRVKRDRPRADHPWDMDRACTDIAPPRGSSAATPGPDAPHAPGAPGSGPGTGAQTAAGTDPAAGAGSDAGTAPTDTALPSDRSIANGLLAPHPGGPPSVPVARSGADEPAVTAAPATPTGAGPGSGSPPVGAAPAAAAAAPAPAAAPAAAAPAPAVVAAADPAAALASRSATDAPTSAYLEGTVAVGLVLVEGPTADLQFTAAERTKIVAEVQNGLSWLATRNPAADITFSYDIQIVRIDRPVNASASDLEAYWRDPAMAKLGHAANFDGVWDYVDALRTRLGTRWAYCAYFTKYPVPYFAYSAIGGPRLVMTYENDGWGPDNIDRVFTHESGHIFGAVDEYASAGCDCGGAFGRFKVPNGNCDACAAPVADCLMRSNSYAFCRYTPAHIGWGAGAAGNPVLIQSKGLGQFGNFELIVPSSFDGLTHRWQNHDLSSHPWEDPFQTAQALGPLDAVTMVQSSLQSPGPLEAVVRAGSDLHFLWRDSTGAFAWSKPAKIAGGAAGVPSLIQSRFGFRGNFEMLFPATDKGLFHMWRNHDVYGYPWSAAKLFATELGHVDAVSLIHGSRGGGLGVLEAVVRVGGKLMHIWRDQTAAALWHPTVAFADGVAGNPVLIESVFGTGPRNFEVVVPSAGRGLIHYWRNNAAPGTPWSGPRPFATDLGRVDAVTMIQSSFEGHLEVVARVGDRLYQLWRSAAGVWTPSVRIA